eukprot:273828-Chlamydomonas_euryale.AAC.10
MGDDGSSMAAAAAPSVSVLVVANPSPSNPSTFLIEKCIESIEVCLPCLADKATPLLVVLDGYVIASKGACATCVDRGRDSTGSCVTCAGSQGKQHRLICHMSRQAGNSMGSCVTCTGSQGKQHRLICHMSRQAATAWAHVPHALWLAKE